MKNLALFVATVAGYFGIWWYFGGAPEGFSGYAMRLGILALRSAPFNVKGTIWTVLGNAESEKSIYSLFSLYQKAGQHAFMFCGVALYQDARWDAFVGFGVALYQEAGRDAVVGFGVALYQEAEEEAGVFCGVALYQEAGRALVFCGVAFYQRAGQDAGVFCGVAFYQRAGAQTETPYGLAVIQTVGRGIGASAQSKVRCFGVFGEFSAS